MRTKKQRQGLKLALINSGIAAGLVFLGSFTSGHISTETFIAALAAAGILFLTKTKDYMDKVQKKGELRPHLFMFYG